MCSLAAAALALHGTGSVLGPNRVSARVQPTAPVGWSISRGGAVLLGDVESAVRHLTLAVKFEKRADYTSQWNNNLAVLIA